MASILKSKASAFVHYVASRRSIPVFKGVLAYILGFVLIFLRKFDELNKFPATFTAMVILFLVCAPGKSIGACVQSTALALAGVGLGSVGFVVLAKLAHAPIAQGFIFAFIVYVFGLVKARGLKWFAIALLAILMSFNGIYTSALLGRFEKTYLEEYIRAYCWAAAIVLAVNILVFPVSSEKELRRTLILSLEHISTFSHLLAKGYTLESTEEERKVREHLAQSIRADFGFLTQKIEETSIEVNFSRFSMNDYQDYVARTRGMQLALITVHSSLLNFEMQDLELFKRRFLPNTIKSFTSFRRSLDATMRETRAALGCKAMDIQASQAGYAEFMDVEKHPSEPHVPLAREVSDGSVDERLNSVSRRLAAEFGDVEITTTPTASDGGVTPTAGPTRQGSVNIPAAVDGSSDGKKSTATSPTVDVTPSLAAEKAASRASVASGACVRSMRRLFDNFASDQHDILAEVLISGKLYGEDDTLRLADPMPSLKEMYNYRLVPTSGAETPGKLRSRVVTVESGCTTPTTGYFEVLREKSAHEKKTDAMAVASHHSLTRVYSFLFGMEQFVDELEQLYAATKRAAAGKSRLHVHLFETLHRPHRKAASADAELSVSEALALLEHKPYTKTKPNIFQRLEQIEAWFRGPTSVFAAKTAAAASIFAVLILHPVPRPWFIQYGLTGGALTIVTALTPTLGQSLVAFILQILGSGFGYIWAVVLLEIFRNVGGYRFNPYGIIGLLIPYAFAFMYILYEKPQFFVAALLALNGTGTVLIVEWVNVEYLHNYNFDSPVLRMGKGFTTLAVALTIAAIFQLFILRNPARRTLRKKIGAITFAQLSYVTLLQAFARASMPSDPVKRAPDAALKRVEHELRHRELKLQAELISLRPLVAFAAAEPQFSRPFQADIINRFLRTSQIILDRTRESRTAIGLRPLPEAVTKNFTQHLTPYRARNSQVIQLGFFLVASSILSKSPLPRETPAELTTAAQTANFMHDVLVLASRHARTEEGAQTIRSGDFTRYFHYLVSISSLMGQVKVLEEACKDLFGQLEDKLV